MKKKIIKMKTFNELELSDILQKVYNTTQSRVESFVNPLCYTMRVYNINNRFRAAAFLAQVGHESGRLAHVEENLRYSAGRLLQVFPKYFKTAQQAKEYDYIPENIANRVYADRMGNGNEDSGDGWRFRGRGLIQLTGRNNYRAATAGMYAVPLGLDFENEPDQIATPQYAAQSAGWFWESNGLNCLADILEDQKQTDEMFKKITQRINGGTNGLDDRRALYNKLIDIIK